MKKLLIVLLCLPFCSFAQHSWQLFVGKQKVSEGKAGVANEYTIKDSASCIKIKYTGYKKENVVRSFIIMDTARIELFRKQVKKRKQEIVIDRNLFTAANGNKQPIVVYIITTPADKKIAALAKVAPIYLVKLMCKH